MHRPPISDWKPSAKNFFPGAMDVDNQDEGNEQEDASMPDLDEVTGPIWRGPKVVVEIPSPDDGVDSEYTEETVVSRPDKEKILARLNRNGQETKAANMTIAQVNIPATPVIQNASIGQQPEAIAQVEIPPHSPSNSLLMASLEKALQDEEKGQVFGGSKDDTTDEANDEETKSEETYDTNAFMTPQNSMEEGGDNISTSWRPRRGGRRTANQDFMTPTNSQDEDDGRRHNPPRRSKRQATRRPVGPFATKKDAEKKKPRKSPWSNECLMLNIQRSP